MRVRSAVVLLLLATVFPPAAQAAAPNIQLVGSSGTVSFSFDTRYSSSDSDTGSVTVTVRNLGDASGTATPPSASSLGLPAGVTASCSCSQATLAPSASASWTYQFTGTATDSATPAGSVSIPISTSSGTVTYTATISSSRQDAGRLQAQVQSGQVTLPCPFSPSTISGTIAVTFANVGDTSLSIYSPTISHSSGYGSLITLTSSSSGSSSIAAHSSAVWNFLVQVDPDIANATSEAVISGAGSITVDYSTTRTRPDVTVSLPYTVTIPVRVEQVNSATFASTNGLLTHDFGSVEMQRAASVSAQFREGCGYRDVTLSSAPLLSSQFASGTPSATLPRRGVTSLDFGVQFLPGTGADVCRRESWSYQVTGMVGSSSVYSQHLGFTAQPAFQDLTANLANLRTVAENAQPVSYDLRNQLIELAEGVQSRTQVSQGCAGSQGETALLAGVIQPMSFAVDSLTKVDQKLDAGDTEGLSALLVAGSAASRGVAKQCQRIGNASAGASNCRESADLLTELWELQAQRARDTFSAAVSGYASQSALIDAHSSLALVYRALGQEEQSTAEERRASEAAAEASRLRGKASEARHNAATVQASRGLFTEFGSVTLPWNPIGYASLEEHYQTRSSLLQSAISDYELAGDGFGERAAEAELRALREEQSLATFWGVAILGVWVLALLALCVQAAVGTIGFVRDQRTVSLGALLFNQAGDS